MDEFNQIVVIKIYEKGISVEIMGIRILENQQKHERHRQKVNQLYFAMRLCVIETLHSMKISKKSFS